MKKLVVIILLLYSYFLNGQSIEMLTKSAIMLTHAELTDFWISDSTSFNAIIEKYSVKQLKNQGFKEDYLFLSVFPKEKINNNDCRLLLSYSFDEKRFYRLVGFRYSEFTIFFNHLLYSEFYERSLKKNKINEIKKGILKEVKIEGYDLNEIYKKNYMKNGKIKVDIESCYFKSIINFE